MLRDFKFLSRNSGKNQNTEEIENVPVNVNENTKDKDSLATTDSYIRPPLNPIQEQEVVVKSTKFDTTPTKAKPRPSSDAGIPPFRTPEKQAFLAKNRFGWAQKHESSSNSMELRDEGRFGNVDTPRSVRTVGRGNSSYSECNSTQSTPTKSVTKPPSIPGSGRLANFAALSKGIPITSNFSTVVNTVDVPHFVLKEDPSFWMEHNVQVLIRVRPLNNVERSTYGYNRCLKQESAQSITWVGQPETRFTFDHVACETVDQETLFRMVGLPMVENCLSGYNSCMFAYGQTGSGKTFTMLGEIQDLEVKPSPNRGMTPRIFEFLFARIRAEEESRSDEKLKYNCKCSFLEIYNEQVTDLLDPSSTNLLLREDIKKGVYVENLSEFEVQTVGDILKLLCQGSSNRKVAATNMNRESSRSHSVFTCVIESKWEKDSSSNLRFARLNLVDLAGSERQKASGADGERLKEAANINRSLSTLGHVIMVLLDVAHGKPKHVPYRDSRLTFLLQDSLGGNSKTMIIANVSPSICCAAETLNTLKFAQRAKLIQNNAVVNEDSSGDVTALQQQIRLLKEELSALKHQNISRSLLFGPNFIEDAREEHGNIFNENAIELNQQRTSNLLGCESKCGLRVSSKQLKSLETTLAGALRREQMAETSIKQLEAEIEQMNRLVRQREEDTRCTKMMLKFREDKIQRMESRLGGLMPVDAYLLEENSALSEEIQLLRAKVDKNPEVTRFALENIRLLEQLRRFQDFYEEGEREILLAEVTELRDQLLLSLDGNLKHHNHSNMDIPPQEAICIRKENDSLHSELKKTLKDLEECRSKLNCCLENNAKLSREIDDLRSSLNDLNPTTLDHDGSVEVIKESILEAPSLDDQSLEAAQTEKREIKHENLMKNTAEIMDLQLELDILKIILKEEKSAHCEVEETAKCLNRDLELAEGKALLVTRQCEDVKEELKEAKSIVEALESQQILTINEIEDLRNNNSRYAELLHKQELEILSLKKKIGCQDLRDLPSFKHSKGKNSPLQSKLNKMQDSFEKAKKLNMWYQSDRAFHATNEEEMDEVRRQVEAETAEVIVCLQEELVILQQQVQDSNLKEIETKERLVLSQTELSELREKLHLTTQNNKKLGEMLEEKEEELMTLSEEWELLINEIEAVLDGGHEALKDASDQLGVISSSFPQKRTWISEQLGRVTKCISEKEFLIEELNRCLEEANDRGNEMESMLRSLRGAALVITEAHQEDSSEKDKEIILLTSESSAKTSVIEELQNRIKHGEEQLRKTSTFATAAFVIVNRLSELKDEHLDSLKQTEIQLNESIEVIMQKDAVLHNQAVTIDSAEKRIQYLKMEVELSEENCGKLRLQLSEEQQCATAMRQKLEEIEENNILKTREKLTELRTGVSTLKSCINKCGKRDGSPEKNDDTENIVSDDDKCDAWTGTEANQEMNHIDSYAVGDMKAEISECSFEGSKKMHEYSSDQKNLICGRTLKEVNDKDTTITLLKREIESALESLKGVQSEMAKLRAEKEEVQISEKQSRESIESLMLLVLALEYAMSNFQEEFGLKIVSLERKLRGVEENVQQARASLIQQNEVFDLELGDAKVVAAQKTAEASCILAKFEEAQDTMKEADIMINELMIANETIKLEIERLKKNEVSLIKERDKLNNDVQILQSANCQKDTNFENLQQEFESDIMGLNKLVEELESTVLQVRTTVEEDFKSTASNVFCINSQFHDSIKLTRSWLEDIWSEIIVKDCALSVLHLCHMGILLETVTGLNAENGLLLHGQCESNSIISELREHNFKSRRELEMCRTIKGKLLADIKNSFDHISRKEDETGELYVKITTFEKRILDLQIQEELMLQRSNCMGSELAVLMKELDSSNRNVLATLLDQENLLKDKDELLKSQEEIFILDLMAKDIELFVVASELEQMAGQKRNLEKENVSFTTFFESFKKDMILLKVDAGLKELILLDKEDEVVSLRKEVEEAKQEKHNLISQLDQKFFEISQMDKVNKALEPDIQMLNDFACSKYTLKGEPDEVIEAKTRLFSQVQKLESEYKNLLEDMKVKEEALEISSSHISVLEKSSCKLQKELDLKDSELGKMILLEKENESMESEIRTIKAEYCMVLQNLEENNSEFESSLRRTNFLDTENDSLQQKIFSLENCISNLQADLDLVNVELNELRLNQSVVKEELCSKSRELEIHVDRVTALNDENVFLRNELGFQEKNKDEVLAALNSSSMRCANSVKNVDVMSSKILHVLDEESVILERMFQEMCNDMERTSQFVEEFKSLENLAKELISENLSLETELSRKDDMVEGLSFDLRLLQESTSKTMDQKDEFEELAVSIEALENELVERSRELDEAVTKGQLLESQLQEKNDIISLLEFDVSKERESLKSLSCKNHELATNIEDALDAKRRIKEELTEREKINECLETELVEMGAALSQMNNLFESLSSNLNAVTQERDDLQAEITIWKKEFEMAQALAEENEAIAMEARQIAETRKNYAEDKEEEVKLLETSVEELECTVNVLESKVDMVKGEAERQRLQREDLELELHAVKEQMQKIKTGGDADMKRLVDERERNLQEAIQRMPLLEREIAARDAEIAQCKAHISELTLHAEAQAREYKQKFKALEAMAEQVKPECQYTNVTNSSTSKLEKNGSKSRGSGSPFKCIGLGMIQQMKSERDEELSAGRHRIEELEALVASRQKDIFMLNARLAAAESMTHDVIRDLLGVKLDMNTYASLLDNQQLQKIAEKTRLQDVEGQVKEQEVIKLKQELNEFVEERRGWLEEIDKKQAEMVAAKFALEELHQRDRLLTTENELLKMENANHKKTVMGLEAELKKLSGQQNLYQRIHHHAKIKEENNFLKIRNEEFSSKLQRMEAFFSRVQEELAHYRAANGRSPCINFDEEQQLKDKLKETEDERIHLAQKLLGLCNCILKAAGITRQSSDVSLSAAEEALEQLKNRVTSLESELHDVKFKNRISNERIRLSELVPQTSPLSSRGDEIETCQTPNRVTQTPFFSALDR